MAFLTCRFFSRALNSNASIHVIVPTPQSNEAEENGAVYASSGTFPVVYLLHGLHGDCSSWMRLSRIEHYVQTRRCAAVMASGGNAFYQDMYRGPAYATFFTRELPALVCGLFPVSSRREDTFIAGLSMGGYGAWHLALAAPDVFSAAASMSGALDIAALCTPDGKRAADSVIHWDAVFQNPDALAGSDSDLFAQYARCARQGLAPRLFQTCGTEDFLYEMNLSARDRMLALGADLTYTEDPGEHTWDYWDLHIQEALDWMLGGRTAGTAAAK